MPQLRATLGLNVADTVMLSAGGMVGAWPYPLIFNLQDVRDRPPGDFVLWAVNAGIGLLFE